MKVIVIGEIDGEERYRDVVDLGQTVEGDDFKRLVGQGMDRIRAKYYDDHPFDPFAGDAIEDGWPPLLYRFHSEFE